VQYCSSLIESASSQEKEEGYIFWRILVSADVGESAWYDLIKLEMWANAQRDGRPAKYRWRRLFNAAVWLTPSTGVPCSNAAKTRNR